MERWARPGLTCARLTQAEASRVAAGTTFVGMKPLDGAAPLVPPPVMAAWESEPALRARYPDPLSLWQGDAHLRLDSLLDWSASEGRATRPEIARWYEELVPFRKQRGERAASLATPHRPCPKRRASAATTAGGTAVWPGAEREARGAQQTAVSREPSLACAAAHEEVHPLEAAPDRRTLLEALPRARGVSRDERERGALDAQGGSCWSRSAASAARSRCRSHRLAANPRTNARTAAQEAGAKRGKAAVALDPLAQLRPAPRSDGAADFTSFAPIWLEEGISQP